MGHGFLDGGKFHLLFAIPYSPPQAANEDTPSIQQWQDTFEVASELLHQGTSQKMQFGRIYWVRVPDAAPEIDPEAPEETDALLLHAPWGVKSHSDAVGLGWESTRMWIKFDEVRDPAIIVHEWGHYAFRLEEEYRDRQGQLGAQCTGSCFMEIGGGDGPQIIPGGAVIEGTIPRVQLHFCDPNVNHHTTDNLQDLFHGKSCQEVIDDDFDLTHAPQVALGAPTWHQVEYEPRFALVLDTSGNVDGITLDAMKSAALEFVALPTTQSSHRVAMVAYGPTPNPNVIVHLQPLGPTNLQAVQAEVNALAVGGSANLAGGLETALAEILGPTGQRQAASQAVVLVANEPAASNANIGQIAGRMKLAGVRGITLANGSNAPVDLLKSIAWQTFGSFVFVSDAAGKVEDDWPEGIEDQLAGVVGKLHGGDELEGTQTELPAPPQLEINEVDALLEEIRNDEQKLAEEPEKIETPLRRYVTTWVEHGSKRAIFSLNHGSGASFRLYLQRPDGTIVNPRTDKRANLIAPRRARFAIIEIDDPQPGRWVVRALRVSGTQPVRLQLLAFSENPRLTVRMRPHRRNYSANEPIKLELSVVYDGPISDYLAPSFRIRQVGGRTRVNGTYAPDRAARVPGTYSATIVLQQPGSYDVQVRVQNVATAVRVPSRADRPRADRASPVPPFVRTLRFQIQVAR